MDAGAPSPTDCMRVSRSRKLSLSKVPWGTLMGSQGKAAGGGEHTVGTQSVKSTSKSSHLGDPKRKRKRNGNFLCAKRKKRCVPPGPREESFIWLSPCLPVIGGVLSGMADFALQNNNDYVWGD